MKCLFFRQKKLGRFGRSKATMKKLILLFVVFSIYSCQRKESTIENSNSRQAIASADCGSDFDIFFKEFAKDSIFQKKHIRFPLRSAYYGGDAYDELIVEMVSTKSNFKYIDFTVDATAMQKETGKYTTEKIKSKNAVHYKLLGYDNGIMISYKFEIINGCWTMVEILDQST